MGRFGRHQSRTLRGFSPGLSFLEALITLLLIGVVVVVSAGLLHNMAKMSQRSQSGENSVNGLAAFESIRTEILEAVTITSPSDDTFVGELKFTKIDPSIAERLKRPQYVWEPADPSHLLRVDYTVSGGNLVRTATPAVGASVQTVVVQGVDAFSASASHSTTPAVGAPDLIDLKISFSRGQVLVSHASTVKRYLP